MLSHCRPVIPLEVKDTGRTDLESAEQRSRAPEGTEAAIGSFVRSAVEFQQSLSANGDDGGDGDGGKYRGGAGQTENFRLKQRTSYISFISHHRSHRKGRIQSEKWGDMRDE